MFLRISQVPTTKTTKMSPYKLDFTIKMLNQDKTKL